MSVLIGNNGLGLFNSEILSNNQSGLQGEAVGQANQGYHVNVTNGNLILQRKDQILLGQGENIELLRTYNSQGKFSTDDENQWGFSFDRRLIFNGNTITRVGRAGHQTHYTLDTQTNIYHSSEGKGAHDSIQLSNGHWVWKEGSSQTEEHYSQNTGLLKSVVDNQGIGIEYVYDGQNRLVEIHTDYNNDQGPSKYLEKIVIGYNGDGLIAEITTSIRETSNAPLISQSSVLYHYDTEKRLVQVDIDKSTINDPIEPYRINYDYDSLNGKVNSITQSDGSAIQFEYVDDNGIYRISKVTQGIGTESRSFTINYDKVSNQTTLSYGANDQWVYQYDSHNRIIKITSPERNNTTADTHYFYDTDGNLVRVENALGQSTHYEYDVKGNLVTQYDDVGDYLVRTYNTQNQVLTETQYSDQNGVISDSKTKHFIYDDSGMLLRYTVSAEGRVAEQVYNNDGQLINSKTYLNNRYDLNGISSTDLLSLADLDTWRLTQSPTDHSLTEFEYDFRGELKRSLQYVSDGVDNQGNAIRNEAIVNDFIYDAYGNLLESAQVFKSNADTVDIQRNIYTYDGLNRIIQTKNAQGTTQIVYEDINSQIKTTTENGLSTTQVFNTAGDLISQTSAASNTSRQTQYFYDAKGQLQLTLAADGTQSFIIYDKEGRIEATIDGSGIVVGYQYNELGLQTETVQFANTQDISSWFDGQQVNIDYTPIIDSANDRKTTYTYDNAQRLTTTVSASGLKTEYSYDASSNIIKTERSSVGNHNFSARVNRYFFDKDGLLLGEINAEGYLTENYYNAGNQLIKSTQYADRVSLNNNEQDLLIDNIRPGQTIRDLSLHYFYDEMGREVGNLDTQGFLTEFSYEKTVKIIDNQSIAFEVVKTTRYASSVNYNESVDSFEDLKARAYSPLNQTTENHYGEDGRQVYSLNEAGGETHYVYDASGQLVQQTYREDYVVISPNQIKSQEFRHYAFQYNQFGELVAEGISDDANPITQFYKNYQYDQSGRLINETTFNDFNNNRSSTVHYLYDKSGRLTHTANGFGIIEGVELNSFGEVIEQRTLNARISIDLLNSFNDQNARTQAFRSHIDTYESNVDAFYNFTHYEYNQNGWTKTITDSENFESKFSYNSFSELTEERFDIDKLDNRRHLVNQYNYDLLGQQTQMVKDVDNLSITTFTHYDAYGRVTEQSDGRGKTVAFDYQDQGRTIVTTDRNNQQVKQEYDAFGRVYKTTDAAGNITTIRYDSEKRALISTSPDGVEVTQYFDGFNQVIAVKDSLSNVSQFIYDEKSNLIKSIDANGIENTNIYDDAGRVIENINHDGVKVSSYEYDAANRVIRHHNHLSDSTNTTQYFFDNADQLLRTVDAKGLQTDYFYNSKGELTLVNRRIPVLGSDVGLPEVQFTQYEYDGLGNQTKVKVNQNDRTIEYTFDNLGRRTTETIDPGGLDIITQYQYDNNNNVIKVIEPNGRVKQRVYDSEDRLISEYTADPDVNGNPSRHTIQTDYGYDENGRIKTTTDANGIVTAFSYNKDGQRIREVKDANGLAVETQWIYNEQGAVSQEINAQGIVTQFEYDDVGQVIKKNRQLERVWCE